MFEGRQLVISQVNPDITSFSLVDINGRILRTEELNTEINLFDLQDLQAGIYIIKFTSKRIEFTNKLISIN